MDVLLNKLKYSYLMHPHRDTTLAAQTHIKPAQLTNHPTNTTQRIVA